MIKVRCSCIGIGQNKPEEKHSPVYRIPRYTGEPVNKQKRFIRLEERQKQIMDGG